MKFENTPYFVFHSNFVLGISLRTLWSTSILVLHLNFCSRSKLHHNASISNGFVDLDYIVCVANAAQDTAERGTGDSVALCAPAIIRCWSIRRERPRRRCTDGSIRGQLLPGSCTPKRNSPGSRGGQVFAARLLDGDRGWDDRGGLPAPRTALGLTKELGAGTTTGAELGGGTMTAAELGMTTDVELRGGIGAELTGTWYAAAGGPFALTLGRRRPIFVSVSMTSGVT